MADATAGFMFRGGDFSQQALRTSNGVSGTPSNQLVGRSGVPWATLYSGTYKLEGSCVLNGQPVGGRRVFVMPHLLGFMIAGGVVESDGLFLFDGIAPGKYKVIGEDITGETNGVIFAYVDAVPR